MKVIAFNGSPRKNWNTAILLNKALEGAASQGAETELVHLYDLNYKGCLSCFACKTKGGKSYGKCAAVDDLTPILKKIEEADAIILGSPIYIGSVSGEMKSFLERLIFPYVSYTDPYQPVSPRKINTAFIYTMNVSEEQFKEYGYKEHLGRFEMLLKLTLGSYEALFSFDTYQFADYSKVVSSRFDPEQKARRRKEVFPIDCQKAFEMGASLVR